jgi:hypothetical protein
MRHLTALIIILFTLTGVKAQSGLAIDPLFSGSDKWNLKFEATYIRGEMLKEYNLTLFRSITTCDTTLFPDIEKAIESDAAKAIDKECGYINGKLYYGFFMFKPINGQNRYIFYRNSSLRSDENDESTVVYMEGYPTIEELKKMFR